MIHEKVQFQSQLSLLLFTLTLSTTVDVNEDYQKMFKIETQLSQEYNFICNIIY